MRKMIRPLLVLLACHVLLISLVQAGGPTKTDEAKHGEAVVKKYPPYPDVWDWVIPFPERATRYVQVDLQPDGDVRISYKLKSRALKKQEEDFPDVPQGGSYGATFFGRQSVTPPKDIPPYSIDRSWRVTLASGNVLESASRFKETNGCFDRLDAFIVLKDDHGKTINRMTLYYVLSKPQRFTVYGPCYDGADFTYQVEAVPANLVALEDGTFLVVDGEHGLVIRFDEQFKTKSSLLNQVVFAFDSHFVPVGDLKDHGSREEGNKDWQGQVDDIYHYLMSLKGRK